MLKVVYHKTKFDTKPIGHCWVKTIFPKYTYNIKVYIRIKGITIYNKSILSPLEYFSSENLELIKGILQENMVRKIVLL